jgi:hypothetical protein
LVLAQEQLPLCSLDMKGSCSWDQFCRPRFRRDISWHPADTLSVQMEELLMERWLLAR